MRKSRIFLLVGSISLMVACAVWFFGESAASKNVSKFEVVTEVMTLIAKESVYDTSEQKLVEGALRGMAGAIDDPYSTYYSQQEAAVHNQALAGERIGIGIELAEKQGKFVVVSPVKSSPADKAGIRSLDEIVQIDDTRVEGKSMGEIMALIQGKEGQKISLVLYRPGEDRHIKVTLKREKLKNDTVQMQVINVEDTPIGFVTVSMFGEKTAEDWQKTLEQLVEAKVKGLIVDVRDNPGGYLHSVAHMMSTLNPNEKIFSYMQNNAGEMEAMTTAGSDDLKKFAKQLTNWPVVVLQNEGSASASEVFAGGLQDWKRATIMGVTSFGKGTVQQTWELQNGGELKLSTNKWLTPSKQWIHGIGIEPDIEVLQHPLFAMETKTLAGSFKPGDFSEEIAYSQRVLNELGYNAVRQDGYFDAATAKVVSGYRERHDLISGHQMDEQFFKQLTAELEKFKGNPINDMPLQMGLSFIMHQLEM